MMNLFCSTLRLTSLTLLALNLAGPTQLPAEPPRSAASTDETARLTPLAAPATDSVRTQPVGLEQAFLRVAPAPGEESAGTRLKAHPALRLSPSLNLNLADGVPWVADRASVQELGESDFVWSGALRGEPSSRVTLAARNGVLSGVIDRPLANGGNETYLIEPQPDGASRVVRADEPPVASSGCLNIPVTLPHAGRAPKADGELPPATAANPAIVDVMILYTPASRARYGASGIQARILQGVADANTAYQRSGIFITLNLVRVAEAAYTETGNMLDALVALVGTEDGKLDEVHALRGQYGADLVVLVDEDTNYAGISYMMGPPNVGFAPYAFSVTGSGNIPYFTMHHEMGHNMGCNHDRANSTGSGSFPYSFGFQRCAMDGTGVRTVMSYPCASAYATRINYFSNPSVLYNGLPLGVAYETNPATCSDNARSLNQAAHYVAAFFNRPAPLPSAPVNLAATTTGAHEISLAWTRTATNETGVTVERMNDGAPWAQIASLPAGSTAFVDNGLASSTRYTYRARAYNGSGASDYSNEANATTPQPPPQAPDGLTATAVGATSITLSWTDRATNATGVRLERSLDQSAWVEVAVLAGQATAYADANLDPATAYLYRVQACNDTGCSACSTVASATTLPLPPPPPANLRAAALCSSEVSLSWEIGCTNVTGYQVEAAVSGGAWTQVSALPGQCPNYTQGGLAAATTYSFRVRALNPGGSSDYSESANVTTPALAPAAPTHLLATAASASVIELSWQDDATNETLFRLERSLDLATWVELATLPADATAFADTNVSPATAYYYRVQACGDAACSACSAPASATTLPLPPTAPSGLAATLAGSTAVTLNWQSSSAGVGEFSVECSLGGGAWTLVGTLPGDELAFQLTGLSASTTYTFRVRACNAGGCSDYTPPASVTTPVPLPPTPAGLSAAALSASAIALNWQDTATNETSWSVERSTDAVTWLVVATLAPDSTSCTDTGVSPASTYQYRVRACNSAGCSACSTPASATTLPLPPAAPGNLTVTLMGSTTASLGWQSSTSGVSEFQVECSLDGGAWAHVGTLPGEDLMFQLNGLSLNTTYGFRVRACNAGGCSEYSQPASVTTPVPLPQTPTGLSATVLSANAIALSWPDTATNETSWSIERSTDAVTWLVVATLAPDSTSCNDTTVEPASTYHYRIQACNNAGCSAYSAPVSATTLPLPPAAPLNLAATATGGAQVTLTWQDSAANEAGFFIERSLDGVYFTLLTNVGPNVAAFTDSAVASCQTYFYRVLAWNEGGSSAPSNVGSATPVTGTAPKAASNLAASALSASEIKLTWRDNATDETAFRIERSLDGVSFVAAATLPANTVAWTNRSLAPAVKYYFRVVALRSCMASAPSSVVNATTQAAPPAAPSGLLASPGAAGSKYVDLTWVDNSGNETAQYLQQSADGATWKALATLSANVTSYRNTRLTAGKAYYYRIRSYNAAGGYSGFSNVASAVAR